MEVDEEHVSTTLEVSRSGVASRHGRSTILRRYLRCIGLQAAS